MSDTQKNDNSEVRNNRQVNSTEGNYVGLWNQVEQHQTESRQRQKRPENRLCYRVKNRRGCSREINPKNTAGKSGMELKSIRQRTRNLHRAEN